MGKTGKASRGRQKRAGQGTAAAGAQPAASRAREPGRSVPDEELAAEVIGAALGALSAGDQAAYSGCLRQLADERSPGWTRAVGDGLVEFLRVSVRAAWGHGWQPAELVRQVGRELSAEHARVAADITAGETGRYPAGTVDPRWAAQVAALDVLPAGDAGYLDTWRLADIAGLRGAVANAVETLRALRGLRVLDRLLPLPGTARPAAPARTQGSGRTGSAGRADERVLGRIRALLAKAEATEFTGEAEALSGRAQQLMAKYSIDHALLAVQAGNPEAPGGRRLGVDNPYEAPKATLLSTVAQANHCRTVWLREPGLVTVIGFPADLDAVELLFTSLLVQANSAMLQAGSGKGAGGRPATRAFRESFLVSYAVRIGERLAGAAAQAEQEAVAQQAALAEAQAPGAARAGGADLVPFLAARHRAVDDAVDAMFGGGLTRNRAVRVTDEEGWHAGRAAADLASLPGRTPVR